MKNIFNLFLLISFAFLAHSCSDPSMAKQLKQQTETYTKVMAGHDEVMPMTGKISRLGRDMKKYLVDNPTVDEATKVKISESIAVMLQSEEAMFDWMANIKPLEELQKAKDHDKIMDYLKKQNKTINNIKETTLKSYQDGQSLWNSLQPQ